MDPGSSHYTGYTGWKNTPKKLLYLSYYQTKQHIYKRKSSDNNLGSFQLGVYKNSILLEGVTSITMEQLLQAAVEGAVPAAKQKLQKKI